MSEKFSTSSSESNDDDFDTKDSKKSKAKAQLPKISLPIIKAESSANEAPKNISIPSLKELFVAKPTAEATKSGEHLDKGATTGTEASPAASDKYADTTETTPASHPHAEQAIAEELAHGNEIDLRAIAAVPEVRDPHIVEAAVEVAHSAADNTESEPPHTDGEETLELNHAPEATPSSEPSVNPENTDEAEPDATATVSPAHTTHTPPSSPPRAAASAGGSSSGGGTRGRGYVRPPGGTLPPTPPAPPIAPTPVAAPYFNMPQRQRYAGSSSPNVLQQTSGSSINPNQLVTSQVHEIETRAERIRGRREGLLAGLIVGGGIEHFRHKRREKKAEKRHQKEQKMQEKRVKKLEYDFEAARLEKATERKQAYDEKIREEARAAILKKESLRSDRTVEQLSAARSPEKTVVRSPETTKSPTEKIEYAKPTPEQLKPVEKLELPKGHHIERSAWHNIEVDEHGKLAQETSFEYGHEYYKERSAEVGPKTRHQFDEAAGEVALVAAALHGSDKEQVKSSRTTQSFRTDAGSVLQATPSNAPKPQDKTASNSAPGQSVLKSLTSPPTTVAGTIGWFLALIVILGLYMLLAQ